MKRIIKDEEVIKIKSKITASLFCCVILMLSISFKFFKMVIKEVYYYLETNYKDDILLSDYNSNLMIKTNNLVKGLENLKIEIEKLKKGLMKI